MEKQSKYRWSENRKIYKLPVARLNFRYFKDSGAHQGKGTRRCSVMR